MTRQALETFPSFLALSLLGGARHPLVVTAAGVAWIAARLQWAKCYAEGGPANRYSSKWSAFVWYSLLGAAVASLSFAGGVAGAF